MKRAKRLTRKQRQIANRAARDSAAQQPRKPRKIEPMFSLTRYLQANAERKLAKKHFRQHKHEHSHDHDHDHDHEHEEVAEETVEESK